MKLKITIIVAALFLSINIRETIRISVEIFCETKEIYAVCFDKISETAECRKPVVDERTSFITNSVHFYGNLILESSGANNIAIGGISRLAQIKIRNDICICLSLEIKLIILLFGAS